MFSRPLAVAMFSVSCLVSVALPKNTTAQEPTQQSLVQRAVDAVLKQVSLDTTVLAPKTGKPISANGSWSIAKDPPPSCPLDSQCATVFYKVPEADVLCQWIVALSSNDEATILDQNADASRYTVRTLSQDQAKTFVLSRKEPAYPPIGIVAHMGGEVIVRLSVSTSGKPEKADIVSASNAMFRRTASDAAMGWKFKPLMVGTQAIRFVTTLKFVFVTSGPGSASVTSMP